MMAVSDMIIIPVLDMLLVSLVRMAHASLSAK